MLLTVFCLAMIVAFVAFLAATKSAYVLFGAILFVLLLTGILRRPIRYRENRWIFVFYRWTLRVVTATEQITGNPNEIKLYQRDRGSRDSFIAISAGEVQTVSGMSMYPYKGHRLFVLFPVPFFCRAVWQANLFFAGAVMVLLTGLAAVGFVPYQRLRHTEALLGITTPAEVLHSDSESVINDPVLDNILLIIRDPAGGAELLEVFSFRHSSGEVMPLYLNTGLYAETAPAHYETVANYCASHGAGEIAALVEEQYCLHIDDVLCFGYEGLCALTGAAGGLAITPDAETLDALRTYTGAQGGILPEPVNGTLRCDWPTARGLLYCAENAAGGERAKNCCTLTNGLTALLAQVIRKGAALPAENCAETSFQPERLYRLTEMLRSDWEHYEASYAEMTAPSAIGGMCVPRAGQYRQLDNGVVYAVPGIIRQYMIRLVYY